MNIIKQQDLKMGFSSEKNVIKSLNEYFKTSLVETPKFCVCDFINNDFCVELKSRNNTYSKYPTTMIGQNKIEYMRLQLKKGLRCILAFQFTDGLYYYELTDKSILRLKENQKGGRNDRGQFEWKNKGYCYIPIDLLELVELTKI